MARHGRNRSLIGSPFLWVVVVAASIALAIYSGRQAQSEVRTALEQRGYTVLKIDEPIVDTGPFWVKGDKQHIYKVTVRDKFERDHIVWCRTNAWDDPDIEME